MTTLIIIITLTTASVDQAYYNCVEADPSDQTDCNALTDQELVQKYGSTQ